MLKYHWIGIAYAQGAIGHYFAGYSVVNGGLHSGGCFGAQLDYEIWNKFDIGSPNITLIHPYHSYYIDTPGYHTNYGSLTDPKILILGSYDLSYSVKPGFGLFLNGLLTRYLNVHGSSLYEKVTNLHISCITYKSHNALRC